MENMQILITIISAAFASSGFWAFITARMAAKDNSKKDNALEKRALLGILHQELKRECQNYIDRGSIHMNEYEDMRKYVFEPYKSLGGNGTAEELMDIVKDLLNK